MPLNASKMPEEFLNSCWISLNIGLIIVFMSLIFFSKSFSCGIKRYANSVSQGNSTKIKLVTYLVYYFDSNVWLFQEKVLPHIFRLSPVFSSSLY